jgi:gliding motility-associated lipoprotein GldH
MDFRFHVYSLCLIFLFMLAACDSSRYFEENKKINNQEWHSDQPVVLTASITDTSQSYNVYINIRHAGNYRFSNLYLFINSGFPGGQLQRDTLECLLAAPDGRWLGDGLGDIRDNRILFKKNVRFPQLGEYRFELIHAMRVNPLKGILDAGIRIEKVQ